MSLHDELLSFHIKESVFLSSDKADIGEMKELELLPDVEVIESADGVSITGCLQLYGKYEPAVNDAGQDKKEDRAETLLSDWKLPPFEVHREEPDGGIYGTEVELSHRIPINVFIPKNKIEEMGQIFAIVDSFDYEVRAANQLQIEAGLKITGIQLVEETRDLSKTEQNAWESTRAEHDVWESASADHDAWESARTAPHAWEATKADHDTWEFVDTVETVRDDSSDGVSLQAIEQKLAELEREVERQTASFLPSVDHQSYGEAESSSSAGDHVAPANQDTVIRPIPFPGHFGDGETQLKPAFAQEQVDHFTDRMEPSNHEDTVQESEAASAEPLLAADHSTAGLSDSEQEEAVPAMAQADESDVNPELVAEETAVMTEQVDDLKVAISGKSSESAEQPLALSSIFAPKRKVEAEATREAEEVAGDEQDKAEAEAVANRTRREALGSLSSFITEEEQPFRRLKVCIIQRNETLQTIAERYSLTVSQIIEENKLTTDKIVEGQVLYIPQ